MTNLREWGSGKYPWDFAECGCCMTMHLEQCVETVRCHDPRHKHMRKVVQEQQLDKFFEARSRDDRYGTNEADKWLNDNLERCVAIRELFRDHYEHNPAHSEAQIELPIEAAHEPVAG